MSSSDLGIDMDMKQYNSFILCEKCSVEFWTKVRQFLFFCTMNSSMLQWWVHLCALSIKYFYQMINLLDDESDEINPHCCFNVMLIQSVYPHMSILSTRHLYDGSAFIALRLFTFFFNCEHGNLRLFLRVLRFDQILQYSESVNLCHTISPALVLSRYCSRL